MIFWIFIILLGHFTPCIAQVPPNVIANRPKCDKQAYHKYRKCGFVLSDLPEFDWYKLDKTCVYMGVHNGDYKSSRQECNKFGKYVDLVRPENKQYLNYVNYHVGDRFWVGYNDIDTEGVWVMNGDPTAKNFIDSPIWSTNKPNALGGGLDCAQGGLSAGLDDVDCSTMSSKLICDEKSRLMPKPDIRILDNGRHPLNKPFSFKIQLNDTRTNKFDVDVEYYKYGSSRLLTFAFISKNIPNMGGNTLKDEKPRGTKFETCTYGYDWDKRCYASCVIDVTLNAWPKYEKLSFKLYTELYDGFSENFKAIIKEHKFTFSIGPYNPEIRRQPNEKIFLLGSTYQRTCLARLGADLHANAKIGIIQTNSSHIVSNWTRFYSYSTRQKVGENGTKPLGVRIGPVNSGRDLRVGGHYINITMQIVLHDLSLSNTKIICESMTSHAKQDSGTDVYNTTAFEDINIKYRLRKPELIVRWPDLYDPGKIYAGGKLKASCRYYISSTDHPRKLFWVIRKGGQDEHVIELNYLQPNDLNQSSLATVKNEPEKKECAADEITYVETGQCIKKVKDPSAFQDASKFCKRKYSYSLSAMNNAPKFKILKDAAGATPHFIDLKYHVAHSSYMSGDQQVRVANMGNWAKPVTNNMHYGSDKLDCATLEDAGLTPQNCLSRHPFLCETTQKTIPSPLSFDANKGPVWDSFITLEIKDRDLLDTSQLLCRVGLPDPSEGFDTSSIVTDSDESDTFKYDYGPLPPEIKVTEPIIPWQDIDKTNIDSLHTDVVCTAAVGKNGVLVMKIEEKNGEEHKYTLDSYKAIVSDNPHKLLKVTVISGETNDDVGQMLSLNISIPIDEQFDGANITCCSFDGTLGTTADLTSHYTKAELTGTYNLNFSALDDDLMDVIEKNKQRSISKSDASAGGFSILLFLLALLALGAVAAMLLTMYPAAVSKRTETEAWAEEEMQVWYVPVAAVASQTDDLGDEQTEQKEDDVHKAGSQSSTMV